MKRLRLRVDYFLIQLPKADLILDIDSQLLEVNISPFRRLRLRVDCILIQLPKADLILDIDIQLLEANISTILTFEKMGKQNFYTL